METEAAVTTGGSMVGSASGTDPWARFYPPAVTADLAGAFPTMLAAWDSHVRARPTAAAVHFFDATLSFAEIDSAADALACVLQERGVEPGDRVAVYLQNDPQW